MKLFDYGAFPTDIKLFNLKESGRTFLRTWYKCDQKVAPYSRLIFANQSSRVFVTFDAQASYEVFSDVWQGFRRHEVTQVTA